MEDYAKTIIADGDDSVLCNRSMPRRIVSW